MTPCDALSYIRARGFGLFASLLVTLMSCGGRSLLPDGAGSGPSRDARGSDDVRADATPSIGRYRAIGIATGELHACALLDDHRVKCWGDNGYGQLGYGDLHARGSSLAEMGKALPFVDLGANRSVTKVAAGRYTTCAILDDGSLKCWGWSGLNGSFPSNLGDAPNEMGDYLKPLDFGGRKAIDVAIGNAAACAVTDDDAIWCWGASAGPPQRQTMSPAKSVKLLIAADQSVAALYSDGTVSSALPQLPGAAPLFPPEQTFVTLSGANMAQTCGLTDSTTVICAPRGILNSTMTLPAAAIALGMQWGGRLCVIFSDGSVECPGAACADAYWCDSQHHIATGAPVAALSSGGLDFSCVILADGRVKCWDENSSHKATPWLGSSVSADNGVTVWESVDLGTRP